MPQEKTHTEELDQLRLMLQERVNVIADHAFRDRDPAAHLARLREVSESIAAIHVRCKGALPARLAHYLERASYQKALDFLEGAES